MSRKLKRQQKQGAQNKAPVKLNSQVFSNQDRELAKKLEEGFVAMGELKGIGVAEQIFRGRVLNDVAAIPHIGPKRFVQVAHALGFTDITEKEYKK